MVKWQRALYQPNLPLGENGERMTACSRHIELSRKAAREGMVLLKNENHMLPLANGAKIALFGKATFDYVKGGGGSGDVTVAYTTNLYEGFKRLCGRVSVEEDVAAFYRKNVEEQYKNGALPGMTVEPELPDELCAKARAFTDTAVISISRFSGEGWDRDAGMGAEKLFEHGDFYLSDAERAMVDKVKTYFSQIIVVLNVGGMVDTGWFAQDERIRAALMAWQGGIEGGMAAAELLCGLDNPSGKLADTFAKRLADYLSTASFHESKDYVEYVEDIYVGYRYFETMPGVGEQVVYPFGYGLSYTEFEREVLSAKETDGCVRIDVQVTNIGQMAGREIVQLYAGAPQGRLGKPKKSLAAFQKTGTLQPGESQRIILKVSMNDLASYDDLGKVAKSAWVLEKGEYLFYVGNSVRDAAEPVLAVNVSENRVVSQLTAKLVPTALKKRMLADGSFEELPLGEQNDYDYSALGHQRYEDMNMCLPLWNPVVKRNSRRNPLKDGVRPLLDVAEGRMSLDDFIDQMADEEMVYLLGGQPNTGVGNTWGYGAMPVYGIPNLMSADGPAGLRIHPVCGINTTAWPCATLLACTWDPQIVYQVGEAGAKEVKENNLCVWLTPAVNIHRSPLCGRNFEYYSEDPLLAGKLASAMVKGIQSQHIAATVKHFACNNKETNRRNCDSRVSERAAREIYLKAFEIIVKEADPWCIMTAYNIVNGHRASENHDLITGILKEEWGFKGMVMTDWWTFGEHYKEVKAGNDIKMPCGFPERLLEAREAGLINREDLTACVKRLLEMILKID